MKKLHFYSWTLLFLGLFNWTIGVGQNKYARVDSSKFDYAILQYAFLGLTNNLSVIYNDTSMVDLKGQLNIKRDMNDKISFEYKLIATGLKYLDSQGFELVSSLAYGDFGKDVIKEYVFRRKKKNSR